MVLLSPNTETRKSSGLFVYRKSLENVKSAAREWVKGSLTLSSSIVLSIFDHAPLKNYISAVIYSSM